MGSDAHVIVVGGPRSLALEAQHRIADLERRWSRFDEQSEVSTLTRDAGLPVVVSPETVELVERAVGAWRMTGGLFDPTVLGAVIRAGYDRSFDDARREPRRRHERAHDAEPAESRSAPTPFACPPAPGSIPAASARGSRPTSSSTSSAPRARPACA